MIEQLSVFLENQPGPARPRWRACSATPGTTCARSWSPTPRSSAWRASSATGRAPRSAALEDAGLRRHGDRRSIAVEVPDRPGGLADVLEALGARGHQRGVRLLLRGAQRRGRASTSSASRTPAAAHGRARARRASGRLTRRRASTQAGLSRGLRPRRRSGRAGPRSRPCPRARPAPPTVTDAVLCAPSRSATPARTPVAPRRSPPSRRRLRQQRGRTSRPRAVPTSSTRRTSLRMWFGDRRSSDRAARGRKLGGQRRAPA